MQVEVSVQECFSANHGQILVSAETWEIWFRHWLELLNPIDVDDSLPLHLHEAYELSLRLTDDREIQTLNHHYRHKDQATDVLAFAALEVDSPLPVDELEALYLGDIVISIDTAIRQAQQQGHSLQTELAWLSAHGLLHLLGWDHPDDESLTRMLNQQQVLLTAIELTVPIAS